jgi:ATP-dependent DNA helicase RecG
LILDVSGGESATLEFKKSTAEKDKACRTICAFANGQGGALVFGVTPSGKVLGQEVTDRTLEELAQEFQGFEPPLHPRIQRIPVRVSDDKKLEALLVRVERSSQLPVSFRGVPYERVLNTTRVMPRCDYQRLLLESIHSRDRWEIQIANGLGLGDLDLNELVVTIEEAIRRGRLVDPGTREPLTLLRGLASWFTMTRSVARCCGPILQRRARYTCIPAISTATCALQRHHTQRVFGQPSIQQQRVRPHATRGTIPA